MILRRDAIDAVLFDKDGTLFDFQRTWSRLAAEVVEELAEGDAALADALADAAGFDRAAGRFRAHSPLVSGSALDVMRAWVALLPAHDPMALVQLLDRRAKAIGAGQLAPAAQDLRGLLDRLTGAGLVLGVATHDSAEAARRQLAAVDALAPFAFIAGYDSGYAPKPDRAMLDGFAAATGVAPGRVVVVGDSLHDLGMGRAGGALATIGVLTGAANAAGLAPLADLILADIDGLPKALGLEP